METGNAVIGALSGLAVGAVLAVTLPATLTAAAVAGIAAAATAIALIFVDIIPDSWKAAVGDVTIKAWNMIEASEKAILSALESAGMPDWLAKAVTAPVYGAKRALEEIDHLYQAAKNWVARYIDPLTLDLDGDGVETVGIQDGSVVYFDHNNDGVRTATGWVAPDDGFLVYDRNGNGTIDNGSELFGDSTLLSNGDLAADGFEALSDQDTNNDGLVNALDDNFNQLRVWRDLNQDGISQSSELYTLSELGITEFLTTSVQNQEILQNGNVIGHKGSFVKDNTLLSYESLDSAMADVNLIADTFHTEFSDPIILSEAILALPEIRGRGQVRDLHDAAAISPELETLLSNYAQAATRQEQMGSVDALILAWSETSTMPTTTTGAYQQGLITLVFQGVDSSSPEYDELARQFTILERFNGELFRDLSAPTAPTTLNISSEQQALLRSSYQSLKDGVYSSIYLQTRGQGYINSILISTNIEGGYDLNYSKLENIFSSEIAGSAISGIQNLLEFNLISDLSNDELDWDGWSFLSDQLSTVSITSEIASIFNEFNVVYSGSGEINLNGSVDGENILGNSLDNNILSGAGDDKVFSGLGNDTVYGETGNDLLHGSFGDDILSGGAGNDILFGESGLDTLVGDDGNDTLYGGDGNDVLGTTSGGDYNGYTWNGSLYVGNDYTGGTGNDTLNGSVYADTYHFNAGDGMDTINDTGATGSYYTDRIVLGAGISSNQLMFEQSGNDLLVDFANSTDQIKITDWYASASNQIENFVAADGSGLLNSQVDQLIQAMATFSANNGGISWEQALLDKPAEVEAILATYWQPAA